MTLPNTAVNKWTPEQQQQKQHLTCSGAQLVTSNKILVPWDQDFTLQVCGTPGRNINVTPSTCSSGGSWPQSEPPWTMVVCQYIKLSFPYLISFMSQPSSCSALNSKASEVSELPCAGLVAVAALGEPQHHCSHSLHPAACFSFETGELPGVQRGSTSSKHRALN